MHFSLELADGRLKVSSSMVPEDLYQEIMLEHNRRPRNRGHLADATHAADGVNPLCGDEIHIAFRQGHECIEEIRFHGQACAIATASASLLTEAVAGLPIAEARALAETVLTRLSPGEANGERALTGDIKALEGVRRYPARAKCAGLSWRALVAACDGTTRVTTETEEPI